MTLTLASIAERLMRCPVAPYHEKLVATEAVRICEENRLHYEIDPFGNILVRTTTRKSGPNPIVLAAHMDHPGFDVRKKTSSRVVVARFLGGVADPYFRAGTRVLLMPGGIRATLGRRVSKKLRDFELHASTDLEAKPEFAVWDLPAFRCSNGLLRGRVCDDLIGVATILRVLIGLRRVSAGRNVVGVLSRAEEVGFQGALTLAQSKPLAPKALVISLETSRELPGVKMGKGVIIRVGDRASIFDSAATRFLAEVAAGLQKRNRGFRFQRALMGGGTCEATAYQEYGYRSAAVCVALGNYHNCGPKCRIGAEFVSESDALAMEHLLVECARQWTRFPELTAKLPNRLSRLTKEGERALRKRPIFAD